MLGFGHSGDRHRRKPPPPSPRLKALARKSDVPEMGWLTEKFAGKTWRPDRVIPLRSEPVEVQVMGRASLDVLHARNVSATGLGIYVPHGFEGIDLELEFDLVVTLPGETPFLAKGVIKHVTDEDDTKRHFGVQFTRIDSPDQRCVDRYVRERQKKSID